MRNTHYFLGIFFLLFFMFSLGPARAEDQTAEPDRLAFHNTEISSDIEVDTRASDEEVRKDIQASLAKMFLHTDVENLISYKRGEDDSYEIGALASSLLLYANEDEKQAAAYQGDWKLVFQYWDGREVSGRQSFFCSEQDSGKIFKRPELKQFLEGFMHSVVKKFAETKESDIAKLEPQFDQYLKTLAPQILEQSESLTAKMILSYPEEKLTLAEKLQEKAAANISEDTAAGHQEEKSHAPAESAPVADAAEPPAVPLNPVEEEKEYRNARNEIEPLKTTSEPKTPAPEPPVLEEKIEEPVPPAVEEEPAQPEVFKFGEVPKEFISEDEGQDLPPAPARTEEKEPVMEETLLKTEEQVEQENIETPPVPLKPIDEIHPEVHIPPVPINEPEPQVIEPKPWPVPEKAEPKAPAAKSPFHAYVAEYLELSHARAKAGVDYAQYTELSKQMGKIKQRLQSMGFYKMGSEERAKVEDEVKQQMAFVDL